MSCNITKAHVVKCHMSNLSAADKGKHISLLRCIIRNIKILFGICKSVGKHIVFGNTKATHGSMQLSASQICSINVDRYLHIDKNILWVTPEILEQFKITSNLSWLIS